MLETLECSCLPENWPYLCKTKTRNAENFKYFQRERMINTRFVRGASTQLHSLDHHCQGRRLWFPFCFAVISLSCFRCFWFQRKRLASWFSARFAFSRVKITYNGNSCTAANALNKTDCNWKTRGLLPGMGTTWAAAWPLCGLKPSNSRTHTTASALSQQNRFFTRAGEAQTNRKEGRRQERRTHLDKQP